MPLVFVRVANDADVWRDGNTTRWADAERVILQDERGTWQGYRRGTTLYESALVTKSAARIAADDAATASAVLAFERQQRIDTIKANAIPVLRAHVAGTGPALTSVQLHRLLLALCSEE